MTKNWIKERISERTSWDGALLVLIGFAVLLASPFVNMIAYAAIAWGLYTFLSWG